ncbi:alpha/beta hydrolase [Mangrovitalea sediminis]|uniref:alpha/beta hydrolase n=1 Tax=Mangrovitalea sediminis TaxID=1982043 RepID=UPI000BE50BA9|nr:alpha/beta hydrolase [Mangrovitalea sediminis]
MYWKTDDIPDPQWRAERISANLVPFEFIDTRPLSEEETAYCRFYGLDLHEAYPDLEHRLGRIDVTGYRIAVHYYRRPDSRGTVFIFHGYFDHAGLYGQLFAHCLGKGYDILFYDLPGHGLSSGEPAVIDDFGAYQIILREVLRRARGRTAEPWFAVGQSTGGAILIDYLLSQGRDTSTFSAVVLLAPLIRPAAWLPARMLHLMVSPFLRHWKRMFSENSANPRFLRFLKEKDPLQPRAVSVDWVGALKAWVPVIENAPPIDFPVTVVQGEMDMTVDWRHNIGVIRDKFIRSHIMQLPEGRHHLVNEIADVQQQVFDIITDTFNGQPPEAGLSRRDKRSS